MLNPVEPLEESHSRGAHIGTRHDKMRYVDLSNHPAWQLTHALWIVDDRRQNAPVAVQVKYNLIDRAAAPAYTPLHGGLLADLGVLDRDVAGDQRF